jgi:hypothetical protein
MTSWLPGFLASLEAPFSVKHPTDHRRRHQFRNPAMT